MYDVPVLNPVTTIVLVDPSSDIVPEPPDGLETAVYDKIGESPVSVGAVKVKFTSTPLNVAVPIVGAPGEPCSPKVPSI